jgi:hypothetical protein
MTGPVSPRILEAIVHRQSANVSDLRHSWASYMAIRLAMIFDIHHPAFIQEIKERSSEFLTPSLKYIRHYDPKAADIISTVLREQYKL